MQVRRSRARAFIALAGSTWLVVAAVLGLRHEAEVAHATDATGMVVHGPSLVGHHEAGSSDLHAPIAGHDDGICWLSVMLHQPGVSSVHGAATVSPLEQIDLRAPQTPRSPSATAALFRLAPKTSPPVT